MSTPNSESDPFVLLRIKFQRPQLRANLVSRPRLLDLFHVCLKQSSFPESNTQGSGYQGNLGFTRKLLLVSAPAGYGKTTALSQWLDKCPYPCAWLSLDAEDSDLSIFLTYLTAAIQTVYPDACPETSSLLQSHQMPPL